MKKYKIIDAHCHIYPDKIAERAASGTGHFYGIGVQCDGTVATLLSEMDAAGIDRAIVQSVATTPHQVQSINEFIAATVGKSEGRFIGFGTLHPDSGNIAEDVSHLISLGLHGVKLHPDIQHFKLDDYRCLKIYELCEGSGLPVLVHAGDSRYDFSNPNRLLPILEIYTHLTVIGAHFGGYSVWKTAAETLAGIPNLYVDCSSTLPLIGAEHAAELVHEYGAERVLFGTDYPMWKPSNELKAFFEMGLTEAENEMILHRNAENLFGSI